MSDGKKPYVAPAVEDILEPFKTWAHADACRPVVECTFRMISDVSQGCIAGVVTCELDSLLLEDHGLTLDAVANEMRASIIPGLEQRLAVKGIHDVRVPAHIGLIVKPVSGHQAHS